MAPYSENTSLLLLCAKLQRTKFEWTHSECDNFEWADRMTPIEVTYKRLNFNCDKFGANFELTLFKWYF